MRGRGLAQVCREFGRVQVGFRVRRPNPYRLFAGTGVLFLHIPRTGGTSLFEALYGVNLQGAHRYHLTAREFWLLNPVLFRRLTKVAVIRDPVARLESVYHFWCRNPAVVRHGLRTGAAGRQMFAQATDLPDFARRVLAAPADRVAGDKMLLGQTQFLATPRGDLGADLLIPYTHLQDGASALLARAGIQRKLVHRNAAGGTRGLRETAPDLAAEIAAHYAADTALWTACTSPVHTVPPGTRADRPRGAATAAP